MIDSIQEELSKLEQQFSSDNRLVQFLRNPVVTRKDKASFVRKMMGTSISETAGRIVSLLCKNNRLEMLPNIINIFSSAVSALKQPGLVTVISSQALNENQKKMVGAFISNRLGKDVNVKFTVQ